MNPFSAVIAVISLIVYKILAERALKKSFKPTPYGKITKESYKEAMKQYCTDDCLWFWGCEDIDVYKRKDIMSFIDIDDTNVNDYLDNCKWFAETFRKLSYIPMPNNQIASVSVNNKTHAMNSFIDEMSKVSMYEPQNDLIGNPKPKSISKVFVGAKVKWA